MEKESKNDDLLGNKRISNDSKSGDLFEYYSKNKKLKTQENEEEIKDTLKSKNNTNKNELSKNLVENCFNNFINGNTEELIHNYSALTQQFYESMKKIII